jgi:predicted esterase
VLQDLSSRPLPLEEQIRRDQVHLPQRPQYTHHDQHGHEVSSSRNSNIDQRSSEVMDRMPGWYDIADFGDLANRNDDEAGILRSQKVFHNLIADEIAAGIPTDRIVLGGFSQGGAMSLMAGITNPTKLGGIFGLSCYLLLQGKVREMVPKDSPNQQTPIFMGHGDADPVVKHQWGQMTADKLKEWGWDVEFKTYPGLPHSAAPQEVDDLERYLKARIPDQESK